jgi:gluconolactonase
MPVVKGSLSGMTIRLLHVTIMMAYAAALLFSPGRPARAADDSQVIEGAVARLDPCVDAIIPGDAELEKIADGFARVEGPVWNKEGGYLLFSGIYRIKLNTKRPGFRLSGLYANIHSANLFCHLSASIPRLNNP